MCKPSEDANMGST
jgi:hypothetical protein